MLAINALSKVTAKNTSKSFRRMIWFVSLLSIIILLDLYDRTFFDQRSIVQLWNPLGLLFGPVIYLGVRVLTGKRELNFLKHLCPFFMLGILYVVVNFTSNLHDTPFGGQIFFYHYCYLLIPISLWYYGFSVVKSVYFINYDAYSKEVELLGLNAIIYIILGVIYTLIFFSLGVLKVNIGLDYRLLAYFLLFVSCLFNANYLYHSNSSAQLAEHTIVAQSNSYSNSMLKFDVAKHYQQQILELFESTEIYLRPDISVDLLSKELGIPKHCFSQVFNVYFKKSFYSFVADYRIIYAINKLELNRGILTLESLAYESGFNSRTSFNHYFKKHTGLTPNEYQANNYKSALA